MAARWVVVCAAGLVLLAGCSDTTMPWSSGSEPARPGGGAGGSLAVTPGSLSFSGLAGGPRPAARTAQVAIQGTSVYVGVVYSGAAVASATLVQTSSSTGDLVVTPVDPAVAGTLTGTVRVSACLDAGCATHVSGSPAIIPVTYAVRAQTLQVSPAAVALGWIDGLSPSFVETTVSVADPAASTASATVTSGSGWLTVSPASLPLPGALTVRATPGSLGAGTYNATLAVSSAGGARQVPVTLTVSRPALHGPAAAVAFSGMTGQPSLPAAQPVTITADGGAALPYTTAVTYGGSATGWLTAPATGTAGAPLTLSVNTASLAPGTHQATVRLTPAGSTAPVNVQVTYTLVASQLGLSPATLAFTADPATDPADLTTALAVTDTGVALTWTATSPVPWLRVSPASGTSGTTVSVAVDPQALATLANGSHAALLSFTSNGPGVTNAVRTAAVTLLLDLPRVTQVAPYVAYAGEQKEVVVRGEGFLAVASPDVEFDASLASSVVVVSDTELRVTPPAGLAAGAYAVSVANGNRLSIARPAGRLVVRAKPAHTTGLIASAGPRKRLVYDAERGCLYGASTSANAVQRWCDAGAWSETTLALSGVKDVALTPDGAELLAITAAALVRISPQTFTVTATLAASALGAIPAYQPLNAIVIPNHGRPLLVAGSSWQYLYQVNPATWTATQLIANSWYSSAAPTDIAVSLDGDRVATGESGITSPEFILYDATAGAVTRGSVWAVSQVSLDRSGSRIGAVGSVYDGAFASLGSTINWRMTVSPGGTRAYALEPSSTVASKLHTYDIGGTSVVEVGAGVSLSPDPGTNGNPSNLLLVTPDEGTLFMDGPNGIVVRALP